MQPAHIHAHLTLGDDLKPALEPAGRDDVAGVARTGWAVDHRLSC